MGSPEQKLTRRQILEQRNWASVQWPEVDFDYDKTGTLIWDDNMHDVLAAVHDGIAESVLPHVPEELLIGMLADYEDRRWIITHGEHFIAEFRRRNLDIAKLLKIFQDEEIQIEFVTKHIDLLPEIDQDEFVSKMEQYMYDEHIEAVLKKFTKLSETTRARLQKSIE